ncbi:MAG: HEAT repeat domain-containing protein [Planctomyces sp.]
MSHFIQSIRTHRSLLSPVLFMITAAILCCVCVNTVSAEDQKPSAELEKELLAVLRSESSPADKAIACKKLAIHGSSECVPDLAKLLSDDQLASWSRIALEAIPGAAADEALVKAADSLSGRLLIGVINSIGVRRVPSAVSMLTVRMNESDPEVASAATLALGRIGGDEATKTVRGALASDRTELRWAAAEACVLCAERSLADGQRQSAVEIYDEVRGADVPGQRIVEATRGAILARGQEGIPLLVELFRSPDKPMFQLALSTAREFPGSSVDQTLVTELNAASSDRAALIIQAMADRRDTVVLTAILGAAQKGEPVVRLSALEALSRIGDESCVSTLLDVSVESSAELAQAAQKSLREIPGEAVDTQITTMLPKASGAKYPVLLALVGKRRIEALPELLTALKNNDAAGRSAALTSIGETVSLGQLSVLVGQVLKPDHSDDLPVALAALKTASVRMPDREACASQLSAAVEQAAAVPTKVSLLQILGMMGGTKALSAVAAAAKSKDSQLQDAASRLLGEWMTEDAAPVLLELARLPGNPFQVRAIRGYIRIARQFVLPEEQRMEMCRTAFDASRQSAEKKLVLDVLKRYPTLAGLKLAIAAMAVPDLRDDASQVTLVVGSRLGRQGVDVKDLLASAGFDKIKLEIVKAEYGSGELQKDVTAIVRKQASELPLITLPSQNYNEAFEGDPAPGSEKKLKIRYVLNGKSADAVFDENAMIIFPAVK